EGLARVAAALEDGAEERVHGRQVGSTHLDLLELVGRLVEHLELEVHATERRREGEVVGHALGRRAVERDHAAGPVLLSVRALEGASSSRLCWMASASSQSRASTARSRSACSPPTWAGQRWTT